MTLHEAYIALNLNEGVGPATLAQLRKVFGEPQTILSAGIDQLMRVQGIGPVTAAAIRNWEDTVDLQSELQRIKNADCRVIIRRMRNTRRFCAKFTIPVPPLRQRAHPAPR
jgi:ERCC4-type nuclease